MVGAGRVPVKISVHRTGKLRPDRHASEKNGRKPTSQSGWVEMFMKFQRFVWSSVHEGELERRGRGEAQALAVYRVREGQVFRVQEQTICFSPGNRASVKRVAKNRVAECLHVYPKLMCAPSLRDQFKA